MSSKQKSSSDVCDVLAQFLSKELKDKCLSENEQSEEETSDTLCSSEDEKPVRYLKSRKRKKHKKHKSKRKKQDSGKEKNQLKKTRYENYDSEKVKSKVSKEEVLKQNDQKIYPEMKNQVVLKSSKISENSVHKDDCKCKNESELLSIQIPLTKMKCIEDFNSLVPVKNLVKPPKECEVVLDISTVCENEIIENYSLESKQEVCDHVKMTEFGTLQEEDREERFSCSKIKEEILDNIKKIYSLNDKNSDDCVKLNQNNFNLLQNSDSKTVNKDTVSSLGTENDISQQLKSACESNRYSYTTVHEVLTSVHTQHISFGEEIAVGGVSNMDCDRNVNNIYLQPKNNEDSLNTKETDEILCKSKGTFSEKGTFQKNSNENVEECADKSESDNENLNPELVLSTEKNSSLNRLPGMSVGEVDKETPSINQLTSLSSKNVHKPTVTEDKGNDVNTFQPQFLNIVSHKKNLSKSKILIKDLKCSMTLQKVGQDSEKKLELLEDGEITSEEEVKGDDNKSVESFVELNSDEGSGEVSSTDEEKKRKRKKKKKHKYKKKKKRATGREKIRNRHCRKSRSPSPQSYSRRSGSRFSTEENRRFDSRKSRSPSLPSYSRRSGSRFSTEENRKFDSRNTSPSRKEKVFDLREKIDKARLLEVARQNVLKMIETGTLPKYIPIDRLKHEQLVAIKAGGKSVAELTEFCKNLAHNENAEMSSSEEERRCQILDSVEEDRDTPFIRHPFKLKDTIPSIKLNIRNAVQVPVKTPAERVEESARLRQQFPVSSGNVHRMKELEWVPVDKDDKFKSQLAKVPSKPSTTTTAVATSATAPEVTPELPTADPQSIVSMMQVVNNPCQISTVSTSVQDVLVDNFSYSLLQPLQTDVSSEEKTVFPQSNETFDVSDIMAQRLHAVRKLQENPNDTVALKMMSQAQLQMQAWVHSKQLPGQFTGSTDARILSPEELSGPYQAWARKDQLSKATPVKEGIGMHLLKKMGWNPGEGLGKNKEGSLEPLLLNIKTDKKGLVAGSEMKKKTIFTSIAKNFSGKHPVSAIMELCTKRRWDPPQFSLVNESGPSHKKTFLFKVRVNGVDYQPAVSSPSKKQAKAVTATVCLQSLGILPRDLDNPL